MNFNSIALKLNNLFMGVGLNPHASSLAAEGDVVTTPGISNLGGETAAYLWQSLVNLVLRVYYAICAFVLNIIDFLQLLISKILGIRVGNSEYVVIDNSNPLIKMLTNDKILTVFKTIVGVALVLIIVFTIFAIIRNEYQNAVDGDSEMRTPGRVFARTLRSIFLLGFFPMIMLVSILLVNAVLAGFNEVLSGGDNTTIAGKLFTTSAYNGNNYRMYADKDSRLPIIVNFEDPQVLGQTDAYSTDELYSIYKNFQETGRSLYDKFADFSFDSFSDTVVYRNNRLYNENKYSGFEKFVCTREQYYVMADFIDYAMEHNLKYYVKSMKDDDINWKYVTSFDKDNLSFTITYKDASNINDGKTYTVTYSPTSEEISTPISDAIRTLSAILGVGDYGDLTFNLLNRLEDSINVVEWQSASAMLRLSDDFYKNGRINLTITDQLLLWERARYTYNNSLDCTLQDLYNGVEYPVKKLTKRVWSGSRQDYITTDEIYVIEINGTLYRVEENEELKDRNGVIMRDNYNNPYFTLVASDFGLKKVENPANYNENDIVDLGVYSGVNIGKYALDVTTVESVRIQNSFKDILENQLVGTYRQDLEDGTVNYIDYDDKLNEVIKQGGWPQKLINDLQVIYKGININNMIATNRWLENLGEYYSQIEQNDYTSNISTGLIHPLGLILSELFLADFNVSDEFNLYTNLSFNSKFDEQTTKALILSLVGESNYFQTKAQLEYFTEIFNVFMAPLLNEVAYYENFELLNGTEESIQLYTYKGYLASMLISSTAANWFYTTAMDIVGLSNFAEDIIKDDGTYRSYAELQADIPERYGANADWNLEKLYNEAVSRLAEQDVYPGDDAFPEYLDALNEYINGGEEAFDGRLDIVLKGYIPADYRDKELNDSKTNLENALNTLNNGIKAFSLSYGDDLEKTLSNYIPSIDDFVNANGDASLKELIKRMTTAESFIVNGNGNFLSSYRSALTAATNYVNLRIELANPDRSYLYADRMEELELKLIDYAQQVQDNYDNLSSKGLLGRIDGNTKFKFDTEKVEDWKAVKARYNRMNSILEGLISAGSESEDNLAQLQAYVESVKLYIDTQDTIDRLNRYYITMSVRSIKSTESNLSLDVVINNRHYTVGQNFTTAKFAEYVLGAEYLNANGIDTVFVDDDYKGLIAYTKVVQGDETTFIFDENRASFGPLHELLVQLGDMSAVLYQMTNLVNLSEGNFDEITLDTKTDNNILAAAHILQMILADDHLPEDLVKAFFGCDAQTASTRLVSNVASGGTVTANKYTDAEILDITNTVLSYFLLTSENENNKNYVDYSTLTLKEIRMMCLNFLVNYEEQEGESAEQNQGRYLAVFAMACGDWQHNSTDKYGSIRNSWPLNQAEHITGFATDKQGQATILRLAGLENRPYEELVGAEYSIDFNRAGIDEANGDLFIICTFDEETKQYYPFMMSYKRGAAGNAIEKEYVSETRNYAYSEYLMETPGSDCMYYPIIAKGVVTRDGKPTAIRQINGYIEYYRNDVVLRNVSEIGLSKYFVSVDQIPTHQTALSFLVNTISKVATGKTLVEQLCESIPRLAAHSNYNFCYGVDPVVDTAIVNGYHALSFNFDQNTSPAMESLYSLSDMNVIILTIGIISLLTVLWKALWGITARMFDITVYFLIGPAVIAEIPLRTDSRDKKQNINENASDAYSRWKSTITEKILSVFAYAIGFNIFFIAMPIITGIDLFPEGSTAFQNVPIFNNVSISFINNVARLIFIIAAASIATYAPKLFAKISGTTNGFDEGDKMLSTVKSTIAEVGDVWSGQLLVDRTAEAIEDAKNLIPGYAIGKAVQTKVKAVVRKAAVKAAKYAAMAYGCPPEVAEMAAKELDKQMKEASEEKEKRAAAKKEAREKREQARQGK